MTERIVLPPLWCSSICSNSMNEICIEHCAIKRDTSYFEPKPDVKLEDMPRFPDTKGMTKEERFTSVTIYLAKVVDHLQGIEPEPPQIVPRISRTPKIDTPKVIAVVAECLQDAQNDPVSQDVDKLDQPPETTSSALSGSDGTTSKAEQ